MEKQLNDNRVWQFDCRPVAFYQIVIGGVTLLVPGKSLWNYYDKDKDCVGIWRVKKNER